LHISKSDTGGAGNAAFRLHMAMVDQGIDSRMLCLQVSRIGVQSVIKFSDSVFRKSLRVTRLPFNKYVKNAGILKARGGQYESFSFFESDYLVHKHPLVKEADIINLHFINGFVDFRTFFTMVRKPIFWTLHDMNPFMGGFHYLEDYYRNNERLGDIEENLRNEKLNIYNNCKNLTIISLNQWMLNRSRLSEHFGNRTHYLIPNTLNLKVFKRYDKFEQRRKFALPIEKIIFLFVSFDARNYRKGGDLLMQGIKVIKAKDVIFCQVGKFDKAQGSGNHIIYLGPLLDETEMAKLYCAVDAVILPSREDNLPNVLLEALACGTPVISTPIGGSLDIIENGLNGFKAEDISSLSLAHAIDNFLSVRGSFDGDLIRARIIEKIAPEVVVKKYLEAYGTIKN
jgi:glycosyltransferase involved in cell wall biosynthesis